MHTAAIGGIHERRTSAGPVIVFDAYEKAPGPPPVVERVVVALEGELDMASARALAALGETVRAHPGARVLVDLTDVTFMGAAALHAFARAKAAAEAGGGELSLHGASTFATRLLELWQLGPVGPPVRFDGLVPGAGVPSPRPGEAQVPG